jgi:hypothetical protein
LSWQFIFGEDPWEHQKYVGVNITILVK